MAKGLFKGDAMSSEGVCTDSQEEAQDMVLVPLLSQLARIVAIRVRKLFGVDKVKALDGDSVSGGGGGILSVGGMASLAS